MRKILLGILFGWLLCIGIHDPVFAQETDPEESTVVESAETPIGQPTDPEITEPETEEANPSIRYQSHIQSEGWQNDKEDGDISGTTGQAKRVEAVRIELAGSDHEGSVEYQAHVQNEGWQAWKSDGQMAGTTGQSKQIEAIRIRLTGEIADLYDIWYRVHIESYGWLGWTKNGQMAGSEGISKRMEAIQIRLLKNTEDPLLSEVTAFIDNHVSYQSHVQTVGWQTYVNGGKTSGTMGKAKRMEAIRIQLKNLKVSGSVLYQVHVQNDGWQTWKKDGQLAGTTGQAKRIEAIRIKLSGEAANLYDICYRTYTQDFGWFEWTTNGNVAGTTGSSKRLEAVEIVLIEKEKRLPSFQNTVTSLVSDTGYCHTKIVQGPQKIGNKVYYFDYKGKLWKISRLNSYSPNKEKEYKKVADALAKDLLKRFNNNLKAIYDWVITLKYKGMISSGALSSDWYAYYTLSNGKGNCYGFSAVVYKAGKALGYDIHQMTGYHKTTKRVSPHSWCEVVKDKKIYLIDPDFEKELHHNGWYIQYGQPNTLKYQNYKRMN